MNKNQIVFYLNNKIELLVYSKDTKKSKYEYLA
jgi:hypothetical protein